MNKPPFQFKTFTDSVTPHGQLQEWAEHYGLKLTWDEKKSQTNGITEWASYPIIQGHHYSGFAGSGLNTRTSRKKAAESIIGSKGILDEAKARKLP
ncbi:hypothetical protein FRC12_023445, partial [Ceratobasidium sp. 428]